MSAELFRFLSDVGNAAVRHAESGGELTLEAFGRSVLAVRPCCRTAFGTPHTPGCAFEPRPDDRLPDPDAVAALLGVRRPPDVLDPDLPTGEPSSRPPRPEGWWTG